MKGLEPSTFCMASRRSSQLSYIREGADYSPASGHRRQRADPGCQTAAAGSSGRGGAQRVSVASRDAIAVATGAGSKRGQRLQAATTAIVAALPRGDVHSRPCAPGPQRAVVALPEDGEKA